MTEPSPSPSSLGRLADLALFAPIGFVCRLRDEVPHLAEAGRARVEGQLRLARVIGELAVKQGRREVVRRLDDVAEQRRGASAPLVAEALLRDERAVELPVVETPRVEAATVEEPAVKQPAAKKQAAKKQAAKAATAEKQAAKKQAAKKQAAKKQAAKKQADSGTAATAAPVDAASLPISDYDSLAASQVVARLVALGPDDLAAIGSYEAATRGRRTILGKVQQLQAR